METRRRARDDRSMGSQFDVSKPETDGNKDERVSPRLSLNNGTCLDVILSFPALGECLGCMKNGQQRLSGCYSSP